jgi:glycosyltransferase involved in cell wall biosynthesis
MDYTITPKISVIMSIFSEPEKWLRESIESTLNQTFSDFEFIIINDNPEENLSIELLTEYQIKDNRIKIINNKENIGLTKSLNKGLIIAKGKYLARMDADDIAYPSRLEKQFNYLEKHINTIVCGTQICYFGDINKSRMPWIKQYNEDLKNRLFAGSCFVHPSVLIRKSILDFHKLFYDESFKQAQDYKLWTDLKAFGEYYVIPEILLKYRISDRQIRVREALNQLNYAYIIRKSNIEGFIKGIYPKTKYNYPEKVSVIDFIEVYDIEKELKKEALNQLPKVRKSFTALFNSHIENTDRINIRLSVFLIKKGIILRNGFDFIEFLKLIKRTYFR